MGLSCDIGMCVCVCVWYDYTMLVRIFFSKFYS